MSKRAFLIMILLLLVLVILVGLTVPLGSYTSKHGCAITPMPTERLRLIFGQTLNDVEQQDIRPKPLEGCAPNTHYTLYLF